MPTRPREAPGPFRADQLRSGDPYELSDGHPVRCLPTGNRGSTAQGSGYLVVSTDPAVERAGIDTGYSPDRGTLRAPDVSVVPGPEGPGWVPGVPPLAIEYADIGQDEGELQKKIVELLDGGTRYLWVVRMEAPRRVEVHEPGVPMRIVTHEGTLEAPGVLSRSIPVVALYEREFADRIALENLLVRFGWRSPEDIREEGRKEGKREGKKEGKEEGKREGKKEGKKEGRREGRADGLRAAIRAVCESRGWSLSPDWSERLDACNDILKLEAWHRRALTARSADEVFGT